MNRTIKFRGRDLVGKMRFGHYATTGGYPYIIEGGVWCEVEPDSVAQFVGYDKTGREVYEGDIVWNPGIMSYQSAQLINNYEDEHITLKEAKT